MNDYVMSGGRHSAPGGEARTFGCTAEVARHVAGLEWSDVLPSPVLTILTHAINDHLLLRHTPFVGDHQQRATQLELVAYRMAAALRDPASPLTNDADHEARRIDAVLSFIAAWQKGWLAVLGIAEHDVPWTAGDEGLVEHLAFTVHAGLGPDSAKLLPEFRCTGSIEPLATSVPGCAHAAAAIVKAGARARLLAFNAITLARSRGVPLQTIEDHSNHCYDALIDLLDSLIDVTKEGD